MSEEEEEKEENENGSPGPRADPSVRIVLSVEANDAKTGVHCPRLRGETTKACAATEKGARPRERTCGGSCVHRALDPCIPTFPGKHRPILPRKEERTASFWLGSASAAAAASVLAYIGGYENGKEETNEERTSTRDEKGRERERERWEEGSEPVDAARLDLIFKCKQIYIVAKAPPWCARQLTGNRRYSATGAAAATAAAARCTSETSSQPRPARPPAGYFFQSSQPAAKAPADSYSLPRLSLSVPFAPTL